MIDVRKLSMLEALDRLGTVAAAADELRLTPSGVSMQLAALEREIGLPLTERQGRRLGITPAGRLLAAHGRDLLDRLSLAALEVEALSKGRAGNYHVAAFPSAARTFVADTWRQLLEDNNGLELELSTPEPEEAMDDLVRGRIDLAVIHSYSNVPRHLPDGVELEHIAEEPVWLAVSRSHPDATVVDLARLHDSRWIAPPAGVTCSEMVERACGLAGYRPRIVARSMDFAAQLAWVAAGVGVALVPQLATDTLPGGIRLLRLTNPVHRHIHAARRGTLHGDAALDRLTRTLRSCATQRLNPT